jgi:hypothetical protein
MNYLRNVLYVYRSSKLGFGWKPIFFLMLIESLKCIKMMNVHPKLGAHARFKPYFEDLGHKP